MLSDAKLMAMALEYHDEPLATEDVKLAVEFAKLVLKEDFRRAQQELRLIKCREEGHMIKVASGRQGMTFVQRYGEAFVQAYVLDLGKCTHCGAQAKIEEEQF